MWVPSGELRRRFFFEGDALKTILEFNLPDDRAELDACLHAQDLEDALRDIRELTRAKLKYAELTESERVLVEEIRSLIPFEILE